MKIIFFGSSDFAVPSLEALKDKEEVLLVVTQPDRKGGRSLKVTATSVKETSKRLDIETFQPEDVNSKDSVEYLKKFDAELFVVISFGQILQKDLLDIPRFFSINVHASLLPKYRGAAPINWALANGEKETGITIIKMDEKMDEGEIILKEIVPIDSGDDAITLSRKLSLKSVSLLLDLINLIKSSNVHFTRQDNSEASYAPKLKKVDGLIDWRWSADKIYNRVRAFVPWPGCFTHWNKKILKIWKVSVKSNFSPIDSKPGVVLEINRDGIVVGTGEGLLRIEELQLEGKRRMKIDEFIIGHRDMLPRVRFT